MKNLTRAERHELANLLNDLREYEASSEQLDDAEAWADRLREEAGPTEPTSYAARFIAKRYEDGHGTRLVDHAEWARSYDSNSWHVLDGGRQDGLVWDQLVDSYDSPNWTIEIFNPREG